MTPEEKAAMRSRLFGAPSPLSPQHSPYFFFSFQFARVAVAGVLVLVLAGGGTAYAAQGALPGSPLYAVKINVNEPVKVALAAGPRAKAAAEESIAQTRVEEAQALEVQGRLDATTSEELEQDFNKHAAAALAFDASTTPQRVAVAVEVESEASDTAPQDKSAATVRPSVAARTFSASATAGTTTTQQEASSTNAEPQEQEEGIPQALARERAILQTIRKHVESHAHATTTIERYRGDSSKNDR